MPGREAIDYEDIRRVVIMAYPPHHSFLICQSHVSFHSSPPNDLGFSKILPTKLLLAAAESLSFFYRVCGVHPAYS